MCCPLIRAKEPLSLLVDPTPTVTLDMKRVSLQDILLEIEKADRLFFSYESSMLKEFRHVSLTVRDESLSYCLKRLFGPLPLVYRMTGHYVILKRKPRQYTISGFVRDSASYESLIAATVVERSSGKGSVSNNYGFYSITLPPGKVVLSSSYVGYEPCSVTFELTRDTMIDLSLSPAGVLGEVVIKGISPRSDVLNSRVGGVGCSGKPGEIVAGPVGRNGCCQDFATATGCDRRNRRHEWLVCEGRRWRRITCFCLMEIRSIIQTMC